MNPKSEELKYSSNLPSPPAYKLRQQSTDVYNIPDFYSYDNPQTRWILTMLTNKSNIKRLIKCGKFNSEIFTRFYQIPDRPMDLLGPDYPLENPAYHQQYVLYLTPLGLAVYLKQIFAVELLLEIKDDEGRKLVHPAEPCFVQKVYKKGDKRMSNELFNSFPILLAIRRNFYEGAALLTLFGLTPQKQFSIIQRESFRESIVLYRDILDYLVELLRTRPGLNVSKFLRIISDPSIGLTTFDVFVFDLELTKSQHWDYVSVFRRILRSGLENRFFREESLTQLLNILEHIQIMGYFLGVVYLKAYYNGTAPSFQERQLTDKEIENLASAKRISIVMERIPTIIKASRQDMLDLSNSELKTRLNYDYQCCIGMLLLMFQSNLLQDRESNFLKIACLLSKIILDTNIVYHFFYNSDHDLAQCFSEWAGDTIKQYIITDFRIRLQDYITFTDRACIFFINKYGEIPQNLIKAPLMATRNNEDSAIIRQLRYISRSRMITNNSQSNMSNACIFNVMNEKSKVNVKLIPSNHVRNYTIDRCSSAVNMHLNSNESPLQGWASVNKVSQKPPKVIRNHSVTKKFHPRDISMNKNRCRSSLDSNSRAEFAKNSNKNNSSLKRNLRHLIEANEKLRNIAQSDPNNLYKNGPVPLAFLRKSALNLGSDLNLIKHLKNSQKNKTENLLNNICTASTIHLMGVLSKKMNLKANDNLNLVFRKNRETNSKPLRHSSQQRHQSLICNALNN